MKKILIILSIAGALVTFSACAQKNGKPEEKPSADQTPQTEPETPAQNAETKTFSGTISDIKNIMFIITGDQDTWVFPLDESQSSMLSGIKEGDKVRVDYTGTLSIEGGEDTVKVLKVEKGK